MIDLLQTVALVVVILAGLALAWGHLRITEAQAQCFLAYARRIARRHSRTP